MKSDQAPAKRNLVACRPGSDGPWQRAGRYRHCQLQNLHLRSDRLRLEMQVQDIYAYPRWLRGVARSRRSAPFPILRVNRQASLDRAMPRHNDGQGQSHPRASNILIPDTRICDLLQHSHHQHWQIKPEEGSRPGSHCTQCSMANCRP